jgi:tetratricopeptide (TPR) repeat protein
MQDSIGSIRLGIEDQNGWVFLVNLSNFPYADRMSNTELDTVFALNTVIAIREPYPRQADVGDQCDLTIQSPSDIVFLGPDDPIVEGISWKTGFKPFPQLSRTDEEWKALGNQHFKAEQYFAATVAYTFGLRRNPAFVALRLNRALANLRLGRFDPAFADCKKVLDDVQIDKESKLKAVYRAAQAIYGQGDYDTARNWYTRCSEVDSSFQDAKVGINKCEQRIKEKETGDYDWVHLWEHGLVPGIELDVADYKGPIQISAVGNRGGGRGVIASRDIKIGELLVRRFWLSL